MCAKHKNTYWSVFSLKQNPNKSEVNADALIKHKLGVRRFLRKINKAKINIHPCITKHANHFSHLPRRHALKNHKQQGENDKRNSNIHKNFKQDTYYIKFVPLQELFASFFCRNCYKGKTARRKLQKFRSTCMLKNYYFNFRDERKQ